MAELTGKTAIVTGAGQGVGRGIALALPTWARISWRRGVRWRKWKTRLRKSPGEVSRPWLFSATSMTGTAWPTLVEQTVERFGGIQILVNNAQQVPLGSLMDVTDEGFTSGFTSGPLATFRLMKLCYPYLKGDGCIINLASTAGRRWDMANFGPYGAVKESIRVLTRAAACEWGADNVRTNVILPHATSPGLQWWIENNPEESAEFIATIPMKRIGDCEQDIGRAVARLCTDDCNYVNGQSIALDGGQGLIG